MGFVVVVPEKNPPKAVLPNGNTTRGDGKFPIVLPTISFENEEISLM